MRAVYGCWGLAWKEERCLHLFIGYYLLCELVCPLLCCLRDATKLICPPCCIPLQLHQHKTVSNRCRESSCKSTTEMYALQQVTFQKLPASLQSYSGGKGDQLRQQPAKTLWQRV